MSAIQEMRRKGHDIRKRKNRNINYGRHESKHEYRCGFVVNKGIRHLVTGFTSVGERQSIGRNKANFFLCLAFFNPKVQGTTLGKFYLYEETSDRIKLIDFAVAINEASQYS